MSENTHTSRPADRRMQIIRMIVLLVVIGSTLYIFSMRDRASELTSYGYPGIFLVNMLASGTILMPAPGVIVTFAFGGVFQPSWIGVVAGAGAAVGELTGYAIGFSGQAVVLNVAYYKSLLGWMKRHTGATMLVLLVMATIPNPFFDLVGMAAGVLRVRLNQFLAATLLGNITKMLLFAYAGAYSVEWIDPFFQ